MEKKDLIELTKKYLLETDDNIVGVSYGYNIVGGIMNGDMALSFRVKKKLPIDQVNSDQLIPKEIEYLGENFITDVVEGEYNLVACDISFYQWDFCEYNPGAPPPPNRYKFRPLKGGISTINTSSFPLYTMGTLGFMAIDNEDGSIVGVSNAHVYIDDPFIATDRTNPSILTDVMNDVTIQPYHIVSDTIGVVKRYIPMRQSIWNTVDCSLTTLDASVISNTESWKQVGLTMDLTAPPFAITSEIDNLLITNPLLYSSGNRTGAKGEGVMKLKAFSLINALRIKYNKQGVDTDVYMNNCIQFMATQDNGVTICPYPINGGDSGSALLADIDGVKKIIGLVFALGGVKDINGNYVPNMIGTACRIDNVANQLNISAWNGTTPNYSDKNNIQQCIVAGLDSRTNLTYNGNTYWQVGLTNNAPT